MTNIGWLRRPWENGTKWHFLAAFAKVFSANSLRTASGLLRLKHRIRHALRRCTRCVPSHSLGHETGRVGAFADFALICGCGIAGRGQVWLWVGGQVIEKGEARTQTHTLSTY